MGEIRELEKVRGVGRDEKGSRKISVRYGK